MLSLKRNFGASWAEEEVNNRSKYFQLLSDVFYTAKHWRLDFSLLKCIMDWPCVTSTEKIMSWWVDTPDTCDSWLMLTVASVLLLWWSQCQCQRFPASRHGLKVTELQKGSMNDPDILYIFLKEYNSWYRPDS